MAAIRQMLHGRTGVRLLFRLPTFTIVYHIHYGSRFIETLWFFGFVWRGQMRIITCRIGCISPRRQARKRRTLQNSHNIFRHACPVFGFKGDVRKHRFDVSYRLCEPCSFSLCVDRRDLRSMQCAIPRGAPTLQSTDKRKL